MSTDPDEIAGLEDHQGEPISTYFPYQIGANILIDSSWQIPGDGAGRLLIGHDPARFESGLHGAVLEVRDVRNLVVARAADALWQRYPMRIEGTWVALTEAPLAANAAEVLARLPHPSSIPPRNRIGPYDVTVVAAVFPEEVTWRYVSRGWIFVVSY
jgi:hypothetical protein